MLLFTRIAKPRSIPIGLETHMGFLVRNCFCHGSASDVLAEFPYHGAVK